MQCVVERKMFAFACPGVTFLQLFLVLLFTMSCLLSRYGHYTWEWRVAIRSSLYPMAFAVWFKLLAVTGLDHRNVVVSKDGKLSFSWSATPLHASSIQVA